MRLLGFLTLRTRMNADEKAGPIKLGAGSLRLSKDQVIVESKKVDDILKVYWESKNVRKLWIK